MEHVTAQISKHLFVPSQYAAEQIPEDIGYVFVLDPNILPEAHFRFLHEQGLRYAAYGHKMAVTLGKIATHLQNIGAATRIEMSEDSINYFYGAPLAMHINEPEVFKSYVHDLQTQPNTKDGRSVTKISSYMARVSAGVYLGASCMGQITSLDT